MISFISVKKLLATRMMTERGYIPDIFEEMVGNYYVVNHINPNGRIKLRDEFHNHSTNNYDFYYAFKNYVFEPHWFDISNDSSIRDDDIEKAEFFFEV